MLSFIAQTLQVLISPERGWEDISRRNTPPDQTAINGLYPLIGLTSAATFIQLAYTHIPFRQILPELIITATLTFISFFISRFIAMAIWNSRLTTICTGAKINENRFDNFIIYTLGLLALIRLIANCLPMTLSLIEFLPLVVLIEMWMGYRYIGIDNKHLLGFLLYSALTIPMLPFAIIHLLQPMFGL